MWGVNSICSSIFGLQLFDLNLGSTPYPQPYVFFKIESLFHNPPPDPYLCSTFWGSTPSLAPVTSMSDFRSCADQLWFWIQLQIHIWAVPFDLKLGSTPSLAPVQSMSKLRSRGGLTPDLDPPLDPYLCSTFCGSTPSPALSMSDPRSCWGPLSIQIQLKIHICVVLWGSTPFLAPVTSMSHLQIRGINTVSGSSSRSIFYRWSFGIPTTLCYLQNWMFCPITPFQVVTIQIFIHKLGLFLPDNHFEDLQPYVIFKPECFVSELCSTLSDLKNSFTNKGPFLRRLFWVPK